MRFAIVVALILHAVSSGATSESKDYIVDTDDVPTGGNYVTKTGMSTIFGMKGDKYAGRGARCLTDEFGKKRKVNPDLETGDVGIAHRQLDCGAVVYLTNLDKRKSTGVTIRAVVVDAGPYGAVSRDPDGNRVWYVMRFRGDKPSKKDCPSRKCPEGRWRGIVDLTPRAAHLLGHDGWARIRITYDRRDLRWLKTKERRRETRQNQM